MKKGFTLSEVMVILVVLGIIASITVPQVVKRQIEATNRAKIKKAMSVYDTAINKMVVENSIKSKVSLQKFAGEKCENSITYFKVNQNLNEQNNCEFKAPDGVFWNITDILNPIISLDNENRNNLDNSKTFQLSATFDENGSLRVSDLQYEKMIADEEKIENLEKVYGFITGKEEENDDDTKPISKEPCNTTLDCNNNECKNCIYIPMPICETFNNYTSCYYNDSKKEFDENGRVLLEENNCYGTNESNIKCYDKNKYTYDNDGNLTSDLSCSGNNDGNECSFNEGDFVWGSSLLQYNVNSDGDQLRVYSEGNLTSDGSIEGYNVKQIWIKNKGVFMTGCDETNERSNCTTCSNDVAFCRSIGFTQNCGSCPACTCYR